MSHRIAVCSGSFDPVTIGHVDIFERASRLFDELVICVFHNVRKEGFFSIEERKRFLEEATAHLPNVRVDVWPADGLYVENPRVHHRARRAFGQGSRI